MGVLLGSKPTAATGGGVFGNAAYHLGLAPPTPQAPRFVPNPGDKNNLGLALQNLHVYKPDDQVRVIQRATQAGLLHRDHASALVSGILNNQRRANTQGFKQGGILGALPSNPVINHSEGITPFLQQAPNAPRTLANFVKTVPSAVTTGEQVTARGVARILPGGTADINAQTAQAAQANKLVQSTIAAKKAGQISAAQANKTIQMAANNSSRASKSLADTLKAMPTRGQLAAGIASTAADVLTLGTVKAGRAGLTAAKDLAPVIKGGGKLAQAVKTGSQTISFGAASGLNTAAGGGTKAQIAEATAGGAALPIVGRGLGALKDVFVNGPQKLLENTRVARLTQIGEDANKPVKVPVTDASSPTTVGVRTPTKVPVEATSTADKITVRTPQRMTDPQFNKEFNRLSRGYDVETKQLQTAAPTLAPRQVQAAAQAIDDKYQGQLNNLVETYHAPPLSEPVAPKPMRVPKEATPKPVTVKNPVTNVATPEAPLFKEAPPAKEAPSSANVPGSLKTSGSSVKLDKEFVQKGITQRMEDLPEFETINKADQAAKATKLVNEDRQKAIDIVQGRTSAPDGLHPVAVHNALVAAVRKEGNGDLAEIVAKAQTNRELSAHGQGLSLAAERDPHDPIEAIRQIAAIKQKTAERLNGKSGLTAKTTDEVKAIKAARSTVAPTKQDWHSFVEGLKC